MLDRLLPAIEAANLSPTLYRTAVRIAARTDDNGVARLEWGAMMELAATTSKETARGQLDRLILAGVFECKRNHNVLVVWEVPSAELRESRRFAGSGGESYANRVGLPDASEESDPVKLRESRRFAGSGGESYANRVGLPGTPVGKDLTTGKVGKEGIPTYLPGVEGVQGELLTNAERSIGLLTDPAVGCTADFAEKLAAKHPFEQIRLQVFHALRQISEKKIESVGVIKHRLDKGYAAAVTDADRASDLWKRHELEDDAEAERRRRYAPESLSGIIIS